jgi:hypothetical protein
MRYYPILQIITADGFEKFDGEALKSVIAFPFSYHFGKSNA